MRWYYLHNGNSCTGKMISLYWDDQQEPAVGVTRILNWYLLSKTKRTYWSNHICSLYISFHLENKLRLHQQSNIWNWKIVFPVWPCMYVYVFVRNILKTMVFLDWIGLHLFNDDTRPSGHISRPSQVGFSHSYLCSINEDLWWCSEVGINSTSECSHLVTDLNKELCWIYGLSYQIKESSFSQKLYYASLGDRLKEGPQWVNWLDWICLTTTCPSGHISRPTQVNVSQELLSFSKKPSYTGKCVSELLSFSKQLL